MATLTIGSSFTTNKSGVTGTITDMVQNDNGSWRVCLDTANGIRWTTIK